MRVKKISGGAWKVKDKYIVAVSGDCMTCTCKFYEKKGKPCKHIKEVVKLELQKRYKQEIVEKILGGI